MRKKGFWTTLLASVCAFSMLAACDKGDTTEPTSTLKINVPTNVEQVLGSYTLPTCYVMDGEYLIQMDYTVSIVSVKDPNGNDVTVTNGKLLATEVGVYKITYRATYIGEDGGENVKDAVLEVSFKKPEDSIVAAFDERVGNVSIFRNQASVEYSTDYKYGDEAGSVKVTRVKNGEVLIAVINPVTKDLTAYDDIVYRVYNPTSSNVVVGFAWHGDTTCKPGEWTEVRVNLDEVYASSDSKFDNYETGADIPRDNVQGLVLRVVSGQLAIGESVYFSAVYAECK